MKLSKWLFPILFVSLLFIITVTVQAQFLFEENPLVGKQAPDFTLKTLTGESISLHEYRNGEPAVVYFWAIWCPSCREELKILSKGRDFFKEQGIKLFLVNVGDNPRQLRSFFKKIKLPYKVLLDEKAEVGEIYSIIGMPTLFFINAEGVIVEMGHDLPKDYGFLKKKEAT